MNTDNKLTVIFAINNNFNKRIKISKTDNIPKMLNQINICKLEDTPPFRKYRVFTISENNRTECVEDGKRIIQEFRINPRGNSYATECTLHILKEVEQKMKETDKKMNDNRADRIMKLPEEVKQLKQELEQLLQNDEIILQEGERIQQEGDRLRMDYEDELIK